MITQALLVVLGTVCATVCVLAGQPNAGIAIGGACSFLFFMTML